MSAGSALPDRGWERMQMLSRYLGVNGAEGEGTFLLKKHAAVNSKQLKLAI